jgi:hypothetical protein
MPTVKAVRQKDDGTTKKAAKKPAPRAAKKVTKPVSEKVW